VRIQESPYSGALVVLPDRIELTTSPFTKGALNGPVVSLVPLRCLKDLTNDSPTIHVNQT
jgi:hypothetical protein